MMPSVRVFAPASVSNLGPGFDVLGVALEQPGDVVEAEAAERPGVEIVEVRGDGGALSRDPGENTAGIAASHVLARLAVERQGCSPGRQPRPGARLRLHKGMPLQSGLGSSAASAVAAAVAVNELLGRPFSRGQLLASALEGERAAAGSAHADNVAPSLLGGFVLVRSYEPLEVVRLPAPPRLRLVVVHPHVAVSTAHARALVSDRRFPIGDVVANLGNIAALVVALHSGDLALLGRAVEDRLVEPLRVPLIPGYTAVRRAARAAGARACAISGSGPSMFALVDGPEAEASVALAMREAFSKAAGLEADVWSGAVNAEGARIISSPVGSGQT